MSTSNTTNRELRELGERVREQSHNTGGQGAMQDLVYDEESGCFVMKDRDSYTPKNETVVTKMAEDGFAAAS